MRAERERKAVHRRDRARSSETGVWVETVRSRDSGPSHGETREVHSSNRLTKRLFSAKCWFSPGEVKGKSKRSQGTKNTWHVLAGHSRQDILPGD